MRATMCVCCLSLNVSVAKSSIGIPSSSSMSCFRNACNPAAAPMSTGTWSVVDQNREFGIRVFGQAVPEPATLALLGVGLVGIAASRRRKMN